MTMLYVINFFGIVYSLSLTCAWSAPMCTKIEGERFNCLPPRDASQHACEDRGCCWDSGGSNKQNIDHTVVDIGVPSCYFPTNYIGYGVTKIMETDYGYTAVLERTRSSGWPNDVNSLGLQIWFETAQRLHFKIYDRMNQRYEVPMETPPIPTLKPVSVDYRVELTKSPFGLAVYRKTTGAILFDTTAAPLVFSDQFIQISSALSTDLVYGLGEHSTPLLKNASIWQRYAMWNHDLSPNIRNANLYGSHPFFMNLEENADVHGVFLLNSNAMDVDLQPMPAVTFRTIGGILDFYVFTGPTATDVIAQYTTVIGRPHLPAYWALGYHLCRWGYMNITHMKEIIDRNRKLELPYDVQWNDIEYASGQRDWTLSTDLFAGLPDLVQDLHDHGQRYVIIVDPGTSNSDPLSYRPYYTGMEMDIFIRNATGELLVGHVELFKTGGGPGVNTQVDDIDMKLIGIMEPQFLPISNIDREEDHHELFLKDMQLWPGDVVYPDFTHPRALEWWYLMAKEFHEKLPFDGLWIDMNEISNVHVNGSLWGCTNNTLDAPPYVPDIYGDGTLYNFTICPSASQFLSHHYDLHNIYGLTEAIVTDKVLRRILNKRSLVISRASFPSLGRFGGHWTGDVYSSWEDMAATIPDILEFQFYGIPLVGADICGFFDNTTEELCTRWTQLGAFYPFSRNHNCLENVDQDPGAFSISAQNIMKSALELRYSLLPFMYTQFFHSHINGTGVIQPLFFLYPTDPITYTIDAQFMWGSALLISPALSKGQTEVEAYFPGDLWYDLVDGALITHTAGWLTLKAPIDKINIHFRGGSIVPMQRPAVTTVLARKTPFSLLVAFDELKRATGDLYLDDGESLENYEFGDYSYLTFQASEGQLVSHIAHNGYIAPAGVQLEVIRLLGVAQKPGSVTINGRSTVFHYNNVVQELLIKELSVNLLQPLNVVWTGDSSVFKAANRIEF